MSSSAPQIAVDLVVSLDFGQFYLCDGEWFPDVVSLVERADDVGIAAEAGMVVISSPSQSTVEMPLRVEVHNAVPLDDLEEWEEAFEVHLDVDAGGLFFESPTLAPTRLPVPEGSYHALITGRGFTVGGSPGSTTAGDRWRLQVWPATGPAQPRRIKPSEATFAEPDTTSSWETVLEQSRAAVERINVSIGTGQGDRRFLPQDGVAEIARWLPGDPITVFRDFLTFDRESLDGVAADAPPARVVVDSTPSAEPDPGRLPLGPPAVRPGGVPALGYRMEVFVLSDHTVLEDSSRARLFLNWERIIEPDGTYMNVLWHPTIVELEFTAEDHGGTPGTVVRVTQTQLPRTWTVDFAAVWDGYLARRFRARGGATWVDSVPHPVVPPTPAELAEEAARAAALLAQHQEQAAQQEAYRVASEAEFLRQWGGRAPTARLSRIGGGVEALALAHRDVLDQLEALGPDEQRAAARWLVHRIIEASGTTEIDWVIAGLAAMDAGQPLPEPFNDLHTLTRTAAALQSSPGNPQGYRNPVTAVHCLYVAAMTPDPLRAPVHVLTTATAVVGQQGQQDLIEELRNHLAR